MVEFINPQIFKPSWSYNYWHAYFLSFCFKMDGFLTNCPRLRNIFFRFLLYNEYWLFTFEANKFTRYALHFGEKFHTRIHFGISIWRHSLIIFDPDINCFFATERIWLIIWRSEKDIKTLSYRSICCN